VCQTEKEQEDLPIVVPAGDVLRTKEGKCMPWLKVKQCKELVQVIHASISAYGPGIGTLCKQ